MADINPILEAAKAAAAQNQDFVKQVVSAGAQMTDLGQKASDAITAAGADDARVKAQEKAGELAAQQKSNIVADLLGNNPDDSTSRIAKLIFEHNRASDEALAKAKDIEVKQNTGFFDNPIDWITNQFTLPSDIDSYNASANVANLTGREISTIQNATSEAAAAYKSIAATLSADANAAAIDSIVQKAAAASAQLKQATLGHNVTFLNMLKSATQEQLHNAATVFSAQNANEQLSLHRKQVELALNEKKLKEQDLEQVAAIVNAGLKTENINAPALSANQIRFIRENGNKDQKDNLERWYTNGVMYASTGKYNISNDPANAALVIAKQGVLPAEMAPVQKLLKDSVSQTMQELAAKRATGVPVKAEEEKAALDTVIAGKIKVMDLNVEYGGSDNIRAPAPLNSLAQLPAVANTKFGQTVILPAVKAGVNDSTLKQVWAAADEAEKNGLLTTQEKQQGLVDFYKTVAAVNNGVKDYTRVGITPQTSYFAKVPTGVPFGPMSELTVDAMNPTSVKRADMYRKSLQNGLLSAYSNEFAKINKTLVQPLGLSGDVVSGVNTQALVGTGSDALQPVFNWRSPK